jgi:DNA-binding CsgD family transcriptional regulator
VHASLWIRLRPSGSRDRVVSGNERFLTGPVPAGITRSGDLWVSTIGPRLSSPERSCSPAQRARALEGWASLTDAELKISDLVAQGLTNQEAANRLFVSRHTVDFHLRSVYRKMNVQSRVQLAVLFNDRPRRR